MFGVWWLPDNEDRKIPGMIELGGNGFRLSLSGLLEEPEDYLFDMLSHSTSDYQAEIWGVLCSTPYATDLEKMLEGKRVVIKSCQRTQRRGSLDTSGAWQHHIEPLEVYSASGAYFFENARLIKDWDFTFHEVRFSCTYLADFAVIDSKPIQSSPPLSRNELSIKYSQPAYPVANIEDIELSFADTYRAPGDGIREVHIYRKVLVTARSPHPRSLDAWLAKVINPLVQLLTFSMTSVNRLTEVYLFNDRVKNHDDRRIIFEWSTPRQEMAKDGKLNDRHSALFRLGDINGDFDAVVARWFEVYERHWGVLNLFYSIQAASFSYAEDRFLSIVRIFEAYHRASRPQGALNETAYRDIKNSILSKLNEEEQGWLKPKLARANELSLKERLVALLNELSEFDFPSLIGISVDEVSKRIRNYRDGLTHEGNTEKNRGLDLVLLRIFLEYMFKAVLLKELGMSPELLRNDPNFAFRMGQTKQQLTTSN